MIEAGNIRAELLRTLQDERSLDEFDEWLTRHSWNMHRDSSPEAIALVGAIESVLADFDNDNIEHDELVDRLNQLLYGATLRVVRFTGSMGNDPVAISTSAMPSVIKFSVVL